MNQLESAIRREWSERWPDFKPEELMSPVQLELLFTKRVMPYAFRALDKLQEFRVFLDKPLIINRGHHRKRGARSINEVVSLIPDFSSNPTAYSFHLWCAFDISCPELPVKELYQELKDWGKFKGLGYYPEKGFVHVDDRDSFFDELTTWYG